MKRYICKICNGRERLFTGTRKIVRDHIKEYHRFKKGIGKFVKAEEY